MSLCPYRARDAPVKGVSLAFRFPSSTQQIKFLKSRKEDFTMKNIKKLMAICLCLMMVLTCVPAAFAAEVEEATIDEEANCSLTI